MIDAYVAIPTFWVGSTRQQLIFGIGMNASRAAALSGALWRMGEGHAKYWVAMLFFAWVGSSPPPSSKKLGHHHHRRDQRRTWEDDRRRPSTFLPTWSVDGVRRC